VIGSHGGSYAVYRALAVSAGALDPIRRPDLTNTYPARPSDRSRNGPSRKRSPRSIRGAIWSPTCSRGDRRGPRHPPDDRHHPRRLDLIEMRDALAAGRLKADGHHVHDNGSISVVKIAIDPVWYLPGIAKRFDTTETTLRRVLFEQTAACSPSS
jgi:hypothetical protein